MTRFIVVCDASRAEFFAAPSAHGPLQTKQDIANPAGRAKNHDLVSDEPGRYRKGARGALSAMEPSTSAVEVERQRFSRLIASTLQEFLSQEKYDAVAIVAPPHLMGILRQDLQPTLEKQRSIWIDKDLTHLHGEEILEHIRPTVWPGT